MFSNHAHFFLTMNRTGNNSQALTNTLTVSHWRINWTAFAFSKSSIHTFYAVDFCASGSTSNFFLTFHSWQWKHLLTKLSQLKFHLLNCFVALDCTVRSSVADLVWMRWKHTYYFHDSEKLWDLSFTLT